MLDEAWGTSSLVLGLVLLVQWLYQVVKVLSLLGLAGFLRILWRFNINLGFPEPMLHDWAMATMLFYLCPKFKVGREKPLPVVPRERKEKMEVGTKVPSREESYLQLTKQATRQVPRTIY